MKLPISVILFVFLCFNIFAQETESRYLIPHLTSEQRVEMHQPANGLLVFDTDTESFWYFQAGYWMDLDSGKQGRPVAHPLRSMPSSSEQVKVIVDGQEKVVIDSARMSVLFPDSSTIIGYEAGNENAITTSDLDDQGKYNTFIGLQAGFRNNDDPGFCSPYEFQEIYVGGCSANNTFLGTRAGFSNTLGRNNVFVGSRAGFSNLGTDGFFSAGEGGTGAENTFVGFLSGHFNQNGFWNTFVGAYSGEMNGVGTINENVARYNTYIGASAGRFNKFGLENVYVGTEAGGAFENEGGERNVYLGYRSGHENPGSDNTYVGHLSGIGDLFESGSRNVCIGSLTGRFSSGSDNVFIGHMAGENAPDGDHRLIIGNASAELITGQFDSAMVSINGKLFVNDTVTIGGDFVLSGDSVDKNGNLTIQSTDSLIIKAGQNEIVFDASGNMTIRSNSNIQVISNTDISLTAGDDLILAADDDIIIDAGGDIIADADGRTDITGSTELELNSSSTMDINANGTLFMDGSLVLLSAGSRMDITGGNELELNSTGTIDMNGGNLDFDGGLVSMDGSVIDLNVSSFDLDASTQISLDGPLINLNNSNGGGAGAARIGSQVVNPPCQFGCAGTVVNGSTTVLIGG